MNQFGPDWSTTEMAGSAGTPATYVYTFNGKTLTFTNVVTYPLATLNNNTNRIMPFIKFVPTVSGCASACNIASVDYKWMKLTSGGWVDATLDEVGLVVNDDGAYVSLYIDNSSSTRVGFKIPPTSLSGSLAWNTSAMSEATGVTNASLASMTTNSLCHLGLSYDDKLGMRIFDSFEDGAMCP